MSSSAPEPVTVAGIVVEGDHRGRLLGFPTANVAVEAPHELPADGVYAGSILRADGSVHGAAISLGTRPTFYGDDAERVLEVYVLDFDGDLYGERLSVDIERLVRDQEAFDSESALRVQIQADVDAVRAYLEDKVAKSS